jgi:hypothetical protein
MSPGSLVNTRAFRCRATIATHASVVSRVFVRAQSVPTASASAPSSATIRLKRLYARARSSTCSAGLRHTCASTGAGIRITIALETASLTIARIFALCRSNATSAPASSTITCEALALPRSVRRASGGQVLRPSHRASRAVCHAPAFLRSQRSHRRLAFSLELPSQPVSLRGEPLRAP